MSEVTKYEEQPCAICGVVCSTHPDAGNPLATCGDCGAATCPDHRDDTSATRCTRCQRRIEAAAAADRVATLSTLYPDLTVRDLEVVDAVAMSRAAARERVATEDAVQLANATIDAASVATKGGDR